MIVNLGHVPYNCKTSLYLCFDIRKQLFLIFFKFCLLVFFPFKHLRLSLFSVDNQSQSRQVKLHISLSIVKRIIFGGNYWIIIIIFTISFNIHYAI